MSGQVVVHRRAAAPLKARSQTGVGRQGGGGFSRRATFVRMRVAFARMVATTPHAPWVTEEAVKARRRRHLLEDNPTSG